MCIVVPSTGLMRLSLIIVLYMCMAYCSPRKYCQLEYSAGWRALAGDKGIGTKLRGRKARKFETLARRDSGQHVFRVEDLALLRRW